MKTKSCSLLIAFLLLSAYTPICANFMVTHDNLKEHSDDTSTIVIASTGRSGSSMLTAAIIDNVEDRAVLKTHLLPPSYHFSGKIIFIFSDPNKAAESALHKILSHQLWGYLHFRNMENSDHDWLEITNQGMNQTIEYNLLAQDALRCFEHLKAWLHDYTEPSTCSEADVLAIKYENLWEPDSIAAINEFLNIDNFHLPPYQKRGLGVEDLFPLEIELRSIYNLGTYENPRYTAYDNASGVWNVAPPYQFLKIVNK